MNTSDIIFYTTPQGEVRIEVYFEDETFWLSQKKIAEIFDKDLRTINEHANRIFHEGELDRGSVIRNFRITAADGKSYDTQHYNLDVIIAVGYRTNSARATKFRIWATNTLREFIIKGFVLDDARLNRENDSATTTSRGCWSASARSEPVSGASTRRLPTSTHSAPTTMHTMNAPATYLSHRNGKFHNYLAHHTQNHPFTIIGYYPSTMQRFATHLHTASPEEAEERCIAEHPSVAVCGVRAGYQQCMDTVVHLTTCEQLSTSLHPRTPHRH